MRHTEKLRSRLTAFSSLPLHACSSPTLPPAACPPYPTRRTLWNPGQEQRMTQQGPAGNRVRQGIDRVESRKQTANSEAEGWRRRQEVEGKRRLSQTGRGEGVMGGHNMVH